MTTVLTSTADTALRLRRDATLSEEAGDHAVRITAPLGVLTLNQASAGLRAAIRALSVAECTEATLAALLIAHDGEAGLLRWHLVLRRLQSAALVERAVLLNGEVIARLRPVGRGRSEPVAAVDLTGPLKLSRFVTASAEEGQLVVRAPGSRVTLELTGGAVALFGVLAAWRTADGAAELIPAVPADAVRQTLKLFADAGVLTTGGPLEDPETVAPRMAQWAPSDLALHAASRGPKTVAGYGGTYRNRAWIGPEPVVPPAFPGRRVTLPVPDLVEAARQDPPLTEVLEARRSVREHDGSSPITAARLGELLYRAARLRQSFTGSDGQELADRPYPSGGAVHELEIYPVVTRCAGLDAGLWHYRTDSHELELVAEPSAATAALVQGARDSSLMEDDPQVVLVISARFGRVMWKYETVAYPLILKHVGVLYQTLYLVGTAMGLSVCGLGGGDAADFATASGLDYFTEGSVGELVLGSRPRTLHSTLGVPRGEDRP